MNNQNLSIALVIEEPTTYVDRTLATASWWDEYTLQPGTYYVEWETSGTAGAYAGTSLLEGIVRVDAILRESYRENRLLSEVRGVHDKEINRPRVVGLRLYPWEWLRRASVMDPADPKGRAWGGRVVFRPDSATRTVWQDNRAKHLARMAEVEAWRAERDAARAAAAAGTGE